jgi:hypothetical protein
MCVNPFARQQQQSVAQQQLLAIAALQQQQAAQVAQQQAAAQIASANLDTESSRVAAEGRLRRANMASGFMQSIFGGAGASGGAGTKMLFGSA